MKRIIAIMLITILAITVLWGCGGEKSYKITDISTQDNMIYQCPKKAKAGETVVIDVADVCDADVYVRINDDPNYGHFLNNGQYEFIMPAEDVEIKAGFVANGGA